MGGWISALLSCASEQRFESDGLIRYSVDDVSSPGGCGSRTIRTIRGRLRKIRHLPQSFLRTQLQESIINLNMQMVSTSKALRISRAKSKNALYAYASFPKNLHARNERSVIALQGEGRGRVDHKSCPCCAPWPLSFS